MIDPSKFTGLQYTSAFMIFISTLSLLGVLNGYVGLPIFMRWVIGIASSGLLLFCIFMVAWPKTWWPENPKDWPKTPDEDEKMKSESKVFEPKQRQLDIPLSYSGEHWQQCLEKMKFLVSTYLETNEPGAVVLKQAQGVGIGFVDGDLEILTKL